MSLRRNSVAHTEQDSRVPCVPAVKTYLKTQLRELRKKQAALRREDVDAVHDVRVASRRLRALLSEQGRWFPQARVKRAQTRLRQIGRGLGRARELDVSLELLRDLCGIDDEVDRTEAAECGGGVVKPTTSGRYVFRALKEIRATESSAVRRTAVLLAAPQLERGFRNMIDSHVLHPPYNEGHPARRMLKRYEKVLDAYETWRVSPTVDTLHRIRIALKKLRYTCEIYRKCELYAAGKSGTAPPKEATAGSHLSPFIEEMKIAQDHLGDWHDVVVLRRYLEAIVEDAPECERPGCDAVMVRLEDVSKKRLAAFASYARRFFGKARVAKARALLNER